MTKIEVDDNKIKVILNDLSTYTRDTLKSEIDANIDKVKNDISDVSKRLRDNNTALNNSIDNLKKYVDD